MIPKAQNKTEYVGNGGLDKTIQLMKECITDSLPQAQGIAKRLYTGNMKSDCEAVYDFINENVRYIHDKPGTEEIRTLARLLKDGEGDCDDMAVSVYSICQAMGYQPKLNIVAQNGGGYSHVFTTVGDFGRMDSNLVYGYAMDPVPPLKYFDQIAPNITKNMRTGLDHYKLSGLAGVKDVSTTTDKLIEARKLLLQEIKAQGGNPTPAQSRLMRKLTAYIQLNGTPEQATLLGIADCIHDITIEGFIIPKEGAHLPSLTSYLADVQDGEEIGKAKVKLKTKLKKATKEKVKKTKPTKQEKKQVKEQKKKEGKAFFQKVLHVLPATVAARNAFLAVLKLNIFKLATFLTIVFENKSGKWNDKKENLLKMWRNLGGKDSALIVAAQKGSKFHLFKKKKKGVKGIGVISETAAGLIAAAIGPVMATIKELFKNGGKEKLEQDGSEYGVTDEDFEAENMTPEQVKSRLKKHSAGGEPNAQNSGFESDDEAQDAADVMQRNPTSFDPDNNNQSGGDLNVKGGLFENPLLIYGGLAALIGAIIYFTKK